LAGADRARGRTAARRTRRPRLADGGRAAPTPDSALLQARDTFEVLIKLTATILLRGLVAAGGDTGDWARRQLFRRNLLLGHWIGMQREALRYCERLAATLPVPVALLAGAARRRLLPAANEFAPVRNNFISHGARALDPADTARLVVGLVQPGTVPDLRGRISRITPLSAVLAAMAGDGAFAGMRMEAAATRPPEGHRRLWQNRDPRLCPERGGPDDQAGDRRLVVLCRDFPQWRGERRASAVTQTDGTGQRSSLARMASADFVQTKGLGLALCSAR
jgi:hypothetical protein